MRKGIVIFFASVYLMSTTHLNELLKMPILLEHFSDYEGGFVDFLIYHYGGHEPDEDWDINMKLPFMALSSTFLFDCSLPRLEFKIEREYTAALCIKLLCRDNSDFTSAFLQWFFSPLVSVN